MHKNTYKSQRKQGLFTYLEHKFRWKDLPAQGLPGYYVPRLLLFFVMGVFYVGNTHYHEKMVRKIAQLERENAVLRVDYTALQAGYMSDSKQSEVAKRGAELGLYEAPYPPFKIKSE